MNTVTVKTQGAKVCGHWYAAGTYTPSIHTEFEGPAYYWLEPTADYHDEEWVEEGWVEKGIRLGDCDTPQQLDDAIDVALREFGTLDDSIWLPGATTEVSLFAKQHHQPHH